MTDKPGRWIAVDFGRKHIGLAICDEEGRFAHALDTLPAEPRDKLWAALRAYARDESAVGFVVGLPYNMDGSEGKAAKHTRKFAHELAKATKLPVEFEDERLTSFEAEGRLIDAGMKPSLRRRRVHEASAVLILQAFIARRKRSLEEE